MTDGPRGRQLNKPPPCPKAGLTSHAAFIEPQKLWSGGEDLNHIWPLSGVRKAPIYACFELKTMGQWPAKFGQLLKAHWHMNGTPSDRCSSSLYARFIMHACYFPRAERLRPQSFGKQAQSPSCLLVSLAK